MKRGKTKTALRLLIAFVVVGGVAFALLRGRRAHADLNVPTATAKKGDFLVFVRCRGSLQARRRVELTAPLDVPDLQIVWLAPVNKQVNAGEAVIRFDGSKLQQDLREKTQALKQAQASLEQAIAQEKIDADQDNLDLAKAKADMEKARLEASKQAIVSAIQGEESKIDFQVAEEKVKVQQATADLHKASNEAKIASQTRLRDQAQSELRLVERRLAQMERAYRKLEGGSKAEIPVVKVARGDISLSVFARGDIRGGNSELLTAPMIGSATLHLTYLRQNGEQVKPGYVVAQFDTTDQEYALREANSDLAEAEQHVAQAAAQLLADAEDDRYALLKAQTDVKLAELDVRKNPLLSAIAAKQNDLALAVARDRLAQLKQNAANKKATDEAGIAMQQAGRGKAETQALTAKQNIQSLTLRAKHAGYVSLRQNTAVNIAFMGMTLPIFQVGDEVRPGMAVAEIPDLSNWEVGANISELDRGHLAVGDKVVVTAIAVPNRVFTGHVKDIGGTSGPLWNRRFECKVALDGKVSEIRPGMSAKLEITTDTLHNVLSLPAQALFESDGKNFVYVRSGGTFTRKDVVLVRRNETRVVITGLQEGQEVALASPIESTQQKKSNTSKGPLGALPK